MLYTSSGVISIFLFNAQCYDMALNQLKFQLANEEAAPVITPILEMGSHFM